MQTTMICAFQHCYRINLCGDTFMIFAVGNPWNEAKFRFYTSSHFYAIKNSV